MNMKITVALLLTGATLLLMTARADDIYRWVDKDGNVHYSQTPPASTTVNTQQMNLQPPAPDPASLQQAQSLEKSVDSQNQQQQKAAADAQQQAAKKAQQQQACDAARKQLQGYMEAHRVITNGSSANPTYYSGDDLVKFRERAQQQVNKLCGGS